jgi:hypothetical protein
MRSQLPNWSLLRRHMCNQMRCSHHQFLVDFCWLEQGWHGHDLRRIVGAGSPSQGWEMWSLQHIHKACSRMGFLSISCAGISLVSWWLALLDSFPDCDESQAFLLWIRPQSPQDDHHNTSIPRCESGVLNFGIIIPQQRNRNRIVPMITVRILILLTPDVECWSNGLLGFDLRPFLYPSSFPWQFKKIDEVAAVLPDRSNHGSASKVKVEWSEGMQENDNLYKYLSK